MIRMLGILIMSTDEKGDEDEDDFVKIGYWPDKWARDDDNNITDGIPDGAGDKDVDYYDDNCYSDNDNDNGDMDGADR